MSSKLRVYEVARDLGMDNKELATLLQSIGFSEIKNHMSVVPPEAIERAKRQLERRNEPNKVVEERIRPTVVKRRAVAKRAEDVATTQTSAGAESSSALEVAAPSHELTPVEPVARAAAEPKSEGAIPVAAVAQPAHVTPPPAPPPPVTAAAPLPVEPAEPVESRIEPEQVPERTPERLMERAPSAIDETVAASVAFEAPISPPAVEVAAPSPAAETAAVVEAKAVAVEHRLETVAKIEVEAAVVPEALPQTAAAPQAHAEPLPAPTPKPEARPIEPTAIASQAKAHGARAAVGRQEPTAPASTAQAAAPLTAPKPAQATAPGTRPSSPPRTGIEVWEGRPGVPMSPAHRAPVPRRVQYDAKAGANAAQRRPGQPGGPGAPGQRGPMSRGTRGKGPAGAAGPMGGPGGRGGPMGGRAVVPAVPAPERGAHKRVVKIESSIGLQTLANRMGIKAHELLRKLIMLGMTGVNINSTLDADTAKICASEFGWDVEDVAVTEEQALVIAQGVETELDSGEDRKSVV